MCSLEQFSRDIFSRNSSIWLRLNSRTIFERFLTIGQDLVRQKQYFGLSKSTSKTLNLQRNMTLTLTFYRRLSGAMTFIPLFLHIFGLTMIYKTRSKSSRYVITTTSYFLISLSIFEIIHIIILKVTTFLTFDSRWWLYATSYQSVTNLAQIYCIMIYMTSERFFRIYLGIKYPLYWNAKSTKRLIVGTIITLNITSVPFLVFYPRSLSFPLYTVPIAGVVLLIHFITCYSYIFWKVKKSRLSLNYGAPSTLPGNYPPVKNKSQDVSLLNFKVPSLIVLSICVFYFAPNIHVIFLQRKRARIEFEEQYFKFLNFLHQANMACDALIYIWLTPRIKKRVVALFSCRRCCCCCCYKQKVEITNDRSTNISSAVWNY